MNVDRLPETSTKRMKKPNPLNTLPSLLILNTEIREVFPLNAAKLKFRHNVALRLPCEQRLHFRGMSWHG